MAEIRTLLWDVGGVILSNAWESESRKKAIHKYSLEEAQFNERHELIDSEFEEGRITLDEYLNWVVFYCRRDFSREDFREFMFRESESKPEALAVLAALARSGHYRMATRRLPRRIRRATQRKRPPVYDGSAACFYRGR